MRERCDNCEEEEAKEELTYKDEYKVDWYFCSKECQESFIRIITE